VPEIVLDARSPLEGSIPFKSEALRIFEAQDNSITQVAGFGRSFEKSLSGAVGKLPSKVGLASTINKLTILKTAPQQFWIVGSGDQKFDVPVDCFATSLTSSRFRICLDGVPAREVLAKCAAIDFHPQAFKPQQFAMTGIHHIPVLIHCIAADTFHTYTSRTFALHLWEVLVDAGYP
jgi:methylglutamate dehydrogenase subunit D